MKRRTILLALFITSSFLLLLRTGEYSGIRIFDKTSNVQTIYNPEEKSIIFDELTGLPKSYKFSLDKTTDIGLNLLLPTSNNPNNPYFAYLLKEEKTGNSMLANIDGRLVATSTIYDPILKERLYKGPSYETTLEKGEYQLFVYNRGNTGKFILKIGGNSAIAKVPILESINNIIRLKINYFNSSLFPFVISKFGLLYLSNVFLTVFVLMELLIGKRRKVSFKSRLGWSVLGLYIFIPAVAFWIPSFLYISGICFYKSWF